MLSFLEAFRQMPRAPSQGRRCSWHLSWLFLGGSYITMLNLRTNQLELVMNMIHIRLFFKNQVGEFFADMNENQTEIVGVRHEVVPLALAYAGKGAIDVFVRDAVMPAKFLIVEAQLAEPDMADHLGSVKIIDMCLVVNDRFINVFKFQLAKSEHDSSLSFLEKLQ